jgi:hypothetical protein
MAHLDRELGALGRIPHVARQRDVDSEPKDGPVQCNNDGDTASFGAGDGVLKVGYVRSKMDGASCGVEGGGWDESFSSISDYSGL